MLMENAIKHTKDVTIFMLRQYFNNPKNYYLKLPPQLDKNSFVDMPIYDTDPEELRKFPVILVTGTGGQMQTAGLGDVSTEIQDPRTGSIIAYRYQGFYKLNVNIDIGCKNPLEREVLTDFVAKAIRFDLRRFMQVEGVLVENVSYGGEQTTDYNSDKIYISSLKVDTFSSWVEDRALLDEDEFNIRLQGSLVYTDRNGYTKSNQMAPIHSQGSFDSTGNYGETDD